MKSINIELDSIDKVRNFVSKITMFAGNFDLVSTRFVIDAKSILGIFSLDLSKPLRLDIHDEGEYDKIMEALNQFIV